MHNIEHFLWIPSYHKTVALFGYKNLWLVERYDFFDSISVILAVARKYAI